ncbi:MAG: methionyl-tRNA formyltransferase [Pirellulaceae bacterium]
MRLVMMGTGPFAVPTFESLIDSDHDVVWLVTRSSTKVRTRKSGPRNPMLEVARQRGVPIFAPEDVNASDARKKLAAVQPDLLVVCDYGQILSPETLAIAPLGGVNLHGSLLPKYRGAAPVAWAVVEGESETGVTVIHMTPRLDAGPCLTQQKTRIRPDETAAELEPRLAEIGLQQVHKSLAMLAAWDGKAALGWLQDSAVATRAPRLRKADGQVRWSKTAIQIRNQVRGLKPWPGTFTHWLRRQGEPLRLILDQVAPVETDASAANPGTVVKSDGRQLHIATGGGYLSLEQVQPAGKRAMEIAEFLHGHRIQVGDPFGDKV